MSQNPAKADWRFNFDDSRRRAAEGPCLAGLSFFVAPTVANDKNLKDMPTLIANAGGELLKAAPKSAAAGIVVMKADDSAAAKAEATKFKKLTTKAPAEVFLAMMQQDKAPLGL